MEWCFIYSGLQGPLWGVRSEQTPLGSESISLNTSHSLFLICGINHIWYKVQDSLKEPQISLLLKETRFLSRPKGNNFRNCMRSFSPC